MIPDDKRCHGAQYRSDPARGTSAVFMASALLEWAVGSGSREWWEDKMFLDKLWLRIRGELLTLKEDFSSEEDLRARAADLLNKLEDRVSGRHVKPRTDGRERDSQERLGHVVNPVKPEMQSMEDLQSEWEDLKRRRDGSTGKVEEPEPPPPNPRELG